MSGSLSFIDYDLKLVLKCGNSILMKCHHPDLGIASDGRWEICFNQSEALHRYG